jgi:uncharacterized membrane protein
MAALSAVFAALIAIFAKISVEDVNSDFATFVRSVIVVMALAAMVFATGRRQAGHFGIRSALLVVEMHQTISTRV